jgi:hypothetical protein
MSSPVSARGDHRSRDAHRYRYWDAHNIRCIQHRFRSLPSLVIEIYNIYDFILENWGGFSPRNPEVDQPY